MTKFAPNCPNLCRPCNIPSGEGRIRAKDNEAPTIITGILEEIFKNEAIYELPKRKIINAAIPAKDSPFNEPDNNTPTLPYWFWALKCEVYLAIDV